MTVQDWHAHAEQVDPLAPVPPQPALSLLPPLADVAPHAAGLPDSADTALGARVADELAVLTRVLLGLGTTPAEVLEAVDAVQPVVHEEEQTDPAEPVELVEQEAPYAPFTSFTDDDGVFIAPPVVEVEPLVAVPTLEVVPEPVETPQPEPEPRRSPDAILAELAFLDS